MANEGEAHLNFRGKGPVLVTALGLLIAVSTFPLACGPSFTSCEAHRSCPTEAEQGGAGGAGPADPDKGGAGGAPHSGGSGGAETSGGDSGGGADGVSTGGAVGEAGGPSAGGMSATGGLSGPGGSGGAGEAGSAGESGVDACSPNPCGPGSCALHIDSFLCDCPTTHTGDTCELPRFEALGFLLGDTSSHAADVSKDGRVVVGSSRIQVGTETLETPFIWTHETGILPLADFSGRATATNLDGTVVVGQTAGRRAFRWTAGDGVVELGVLEGDTVSEAIATSDDGKIVVGTSLNGQQTKPTNRAFRWSETGRTPLAIDSSLSTVIARAAIGISSDGTMIVGNQQQGSQVFAYRWTQAAAHLPLEITGGMAAEATVMNGTGSVIWGSANFSGVVKTFQWRDGRGVITFDTPPAVAAASMGWTVTDVSDSPSIVVGYTQSIERGNTDGNACVNVDCTDIAVLLAEQGIKLDGWTLKRANAISADGTAIVGDGIDPEGKDQAWIARLR